MYTTRSIDDGKEATLVKERRLSSRMHNESGVIDGRLERAGLESVLLAQICQVRRARYVARRLTKISSRSSLVSFCKVNVDKRQIME